METVIFEVEVDAEVRESAEEILDLLGLSISDAVNILLRQVVMHKGLPFDVQVPVSRIVKMLDLREAEIGNELREALEIIVQHVETLDKEDAGEDSEFEN